MAWTATNPTAIGAATKKSDYDKLWDNVDLFKADHNTDGSHEKLTVGSDADGDMYYRASGLLTRLAKGAANSSLFMNAAATAQEWGPASKFLYITRSLSADTGNVAYTGVGFKPSHVLGVAAVSAGNAMFSIGVLYPVSAYNYCIYIDNGALWISGASFVVFSVTTPTPASQVATFGSLDADGLTLTWTKTGSPPAITGGVMLLLWR
jgi:hypothetical protein